LDGKIYGDTWTANWTAPQDLTNVTLSVQVIANGDTRFFIPEILSIIQSDVIAGVKIGLKPVSVYEGSSNSRFRSYSDIISSDMTCLDFILSYCKTFNYYFAK